MSVRWDSVLVRAVAQELDRHLRGLRCRAYRLDDPTRVVWLFFDELCVEMQLDPTSGAVLLHSAVAPHAGADKLNAEVLGVSSPPDERRFTLSFRRPRGRGRRLDLEVEWAQNRRNALLLTVDDGRVQDCLSYRGRRGEQSPRGSVYAPPTPPSRAGVDGDLSSERWMALTANRSDTLAQVAWTSPLNVDAVRSDPADGLRLWRRIATGAAPEPGRLLTTLGPQPYPVPLPGLGFEPTTNLMAAFSPSSTPAFPVDPAAIGRLDRRRHFLERELASVQRELASTPDPAGTRATGDLILARLSTLKRGLSEARLATFDGDFTMVILDPTLEPHENAAAFYREAARAERARQKLPLRIREIESELGGLDELRERLLTGEATADDVPRWTESGKKHRPDAETLPYRAYRSSGGLEIRVGRGARFNDDLTFRHSRPNDVWLHARDAAGAHVILRWTDDDNPPARDLEEAAALAAAHSKSRHSALVPVDWTRRKHVRKPRGARAGAVLPQRVKTVFVAPEDASTSSVKPINTDD